MSEVKDRHVDRLPARAHALHPFIPCLCAISRPLHLEREYGGFTSEKIVPDFVRYAETVLRALGPMVKTWYTFNEPPTFCSTEYPLLKAYNHRQTSASPSWRWRCSYQLLRAHGRAVKVYRELGNNGTVAKGEIAYKNSGTRNVPFRQNNTEDARAVERETQFDIGLFF